MSLPAPTFPQIQALVSAIRNKVKDARVIGIRATSRWTGEARVEQAGEIYLLHQCDSPLEMRIALHEPAEAEAIQVLLTPLDEAELGEDVLLRLARRRLFPVDSWQIVRTLFQAHTIDPRLARYPWLAERLLEALPPGNCRPVPGGFLDAETIWPILLDHSIGLPTKRPDLAALLQWSLDADNVARFRTLPTDFRDAAVEWLSAGAGSAARLALRCAASIDRPDALPVALATAVVFHTSAAGKLDKAAGRMEQRYLDGVTPDDQTIQRLSAAAIDTARTRLSEAQLRLALQRSDEILHEVGAESLAHLSDLSPLGFAQRMATLGKTISQALADLDTDLLHPSLSAALHAVQAHDIAARELRRLERIDMAVRLTEWLVRTRQTPSPPLSSFAAACSYQIAEGGFVDWARQTLRTGDEVRELSAAFTQLTQAVRQIRETQAQEFAELLRDWTSASSTSEGIIPVESVLNEVVAPLAAHMPVLLIVMDGMSVAVARELLADITNQDWIALRREHWTSMLGSGLAAIPSVTEVSRASLLCGKLCRGTSDLERNGFARHPALLQCCRAGHPPLLFHKALLQEGPGANLSSDVREAIDSPHNRIVGVVINAVDDQLLKGDQIATRWTHEEIKALPALLHEARTAKRLVILLSDHGHILESGTRARAGEGGERWRSNDNTPAAEELQIRGPRVVMPDNHTLIAPWSEMLRYGGKKNGYHGGVTPQEMVVPIAVLSATDTCPQGWTEAVSDTPTWWLDPFLDTLLEALPRYMVREPSPIDWNRPPILTLDLDIESNTASSTSQTDTLSGESVAKWITQLLSSSLFADQCKLAGKQAPDHNDLARLLNILNNHNGMAPTSTLGSQLNCPPSRLNALLSAAQRILNIDGFAILTRDPISDTTRLDRDLLQHQFDLN